MSRIIFQCKTIVFYLILLFGYQTVHTQELGKLFTHYYSPKDHGFGTQNWDIAQDQNGMLYFGNQSGLIQYDGTNWELFKLSNSSTVRSVEITDNGKILVGGINELGYFSLDKAGSLKYSSLTPIIDSSYLDFGDVWNVEIIDGAWFFQSDRYLFRIKGNRCKVWKNFGEYFYYTYKLNNELFIQVLGKGLYKVVADSMELIDKGDFFAQKKILSILPFNNKLLIGTREFGIYVYDSSQNEHKISPLSNVSTEAKSINEYFIKNGLYSGLCFEKDKYVVGTLNSGALVFDKNFHVLDIISKESTGQSCNIYFMHYACDGNLWLALDNGILKVELSVPFRYWNEETGISGTTTSIIEFDKTIYFSTANGIFYLEKSTNRNKFGLNKIIKIPGIDEQAWSLIALDPKTFKQNYEIDFSTKRVIGKYQLKNKTLIAATSKGLYIFKNKRIDKFFKYENIYSLHPSRFDSSEIYLGLCDGLSRIKYRDTYWYDEGRLPFLTKQTTSIEEDKEGNLWLTGWFKGVLKIPGKYFDAKNYPAFNLIPDKVISYDSMAGLPVLDKILVYSIRENIKFYNDSGDYVFNYKTNKFQRDPGVGNYYIDSTWAGEVFVDSGEKYWINAIDKNLKQGKYYGDSITFKFVNRFLISNLIRDSFDRIWVGASDRVICYNEEYFKNYSIEYPALIRRVYINNDSLIYAGFNYSKKQNENDSEIIRDFSNTVNAKPILAYKFNNISFNYSATTFETDAKNEFSYILEGYDEEWSNWNTETKKSYTNLPEGKYAFKVKARNFYGFESSIAVYSFEILPPWHRTMWAYSAYAIVFFLLIFIVVKLYTKRLINEKEKLENIVLARTHEILMQNEEIMVQAENLKEANEKIHEKNRELENQKDELEKRKDLLELSNATKNKFFRIIAHDLRSPISTFLNSTYFMLDNYEYHDSEKTRFFIGELNKLSQTTFNLLENLLEWSTNQMGEIRFEPQITNLAILFEENIELIRHRVDIKMIRVINNLPPLLEAYADRNMVNTIIRNLLSNAVKYTGEGGEIKISQQNKGHFVEVQISDTGIGIKEQDIQNIFRIDKHFSTLGTQNEKGSGLGLILCKDFVEKNGGTLSIASSLGKGSTFSFSLPKNEMK